ncbi:DUF4282 domain-containing protein [Nocardia sp. NPDC050697]|uniref:DUF4282 domain-containing protein n=1 Tax=Nocardia sp. NPDC050697 TaxID=3155158 RepID=UPI0033C0C453
MSNDSDSTPVPSGEPPLSAGADSADAVPPPGEPRPAADVDPEDPDAGSRWALWREAAARRFARSAAGEQPRAALQRRDPFESGAALREWVADAVRGLLDIRFRREATLTLLPLAYLLGLVFACAVPIALTVSLWQFSAVLGVLAALVAVPLGLTIAAAVRLVLEFLVNAARLAGRVEHISDLADDLFQVLSDVAEPVNQLSEDVRAVQFWRFRRGSRK